MNYCLNYNISKDILAKDNVTEIKLPYSQIDIIFDYLELFPDNNKTYIVQCPSFFETLDWNKINKYNILAKNNLILCVSTIEDLREAQNRGVRAYFGYEINDWYELHNLSLLDIEYVIPGPTLFFDMENLKKHGIKIRITANLAYNDILPHDDKGICGTWIPPKAVSIYEDYVDTIDFVDCNKNKEEALYRIYTDGKWDTELDLIISNLNTPGVVERLLLDKMFESRLSCEQRCMRSGRCHICPRSFDLANPEVAKTYIADVKGEK